MMTALAPFSTTVTFCFTPDDNGLDLHYTSPPKHPEEYTDFCAHMIGCHA